MDQNPKQQIVEKLLSAKNVLVTVSKNPSVDQLASAIGMTLMLNALDSRAVAVFSGEAPNALEFLNPEKNFDKTVDSLRDFIISIDKEKADKLRYKVEGNLVRIFITPYKTSISEADLEFSQGDFNVDVVLALGVSNRGDLDEAIISHGRILHDATIASITAGEDQKGDMGAINWHDPAASSISEMLVSMSEALRSGIIDKAMSTAFLTGIVSATERFANDKTTPKVMTMSAQLMAAGADQQLISKNLRMDRGRTKDLVNNQQVEGAVLDVKKQDAPDQESSVDLKQVKEQLEEVAKPPIELPPELSAEPPELSEQVVETKLPPEEPEPTIQRHLASNQPSSTGMHEKHQIDESPFSATSTEAKKAMDEALNRPITDQSSAKLDTSGFQQDLEVVQKSQDEEINHARDEVQAALDEVDFIPDNHPAISVGAQQFDMDDDNDKEIHIDEHGKMSVIPDSSPTPTQPLDHPVTAVMQEKTTVAPSVPPPLPPKPDLPSESPMTPPITQESSQPQIPEQTPENPLFKQQ